MSGGVGGGGRNPPADPIGHAHCLPLWTWPIPGLPYGHLHKANDEPKPRSRPIVSLLIRDRDRANCVQARQQEANGRGGESQFPKKGPSK
jgi:hypothetical protein